MRNRSAGRYRRGVTLLELIIALALLSSLLIATLGLQRRVITRAADLRESVPWSVAAQRSMRHASDEFSSFLREAAEPSIQIERARGQNDAVSLMALDGDRKTIALSVSTRDDLELAWSGIDVQPRSTRLIGSPSDSPAPRLLVSIDDDARIARVMLRSEDVGGREFSAGFVLDVDGIEVSRAQ